MTKQPSGGLKVQYEAAGALAARGHRVTIVHPMSEFRNIGVRGSLRYAGLLRNQHRLGHQIIGWFELSPEVRLRILPFLAGWLLPNADVTVLTAWQTAEATRRPRRAAGRMAQVVYDYEFWMSGSQEFRGRIARALSREEVAPFSPSRAVTKMLQDIGRPPVAHTPPGVDPDKFGCDVAPEARKKLVGFALRPYPEKAMPVMAEACKLLAESRPDVSISCYGPGETAFPAEVERAGVLDASGLRAFYNRCQVFVLPSHYEGWGLPAAEAMSCGAALVSTANGGVEDFARDGDNALVVPPGDAAAIAGAVKRLLDDTPLRLRTANAGLREATKLSLSSSADNFEQALLACLGQKRPLP
jgi:glycosyltransferase involved in cell wall biosynthesis